jgi:hypothetical protein
MSSDLPVYRIVNGKRERIPGDIRDPNRRYSQVSDLSDLNEQYLLEFTDEQERERDEEERRWLEEAPKREAEAKRQAEEQQKSRDSLVYQQRLVAFFDVLGWREAIETSRTDPEHTKALGVALAGLGQHAQIADCRRTNLGSENYPEDLQVSQFSDSIVVSVSLEGGAHPYRAKDEIIRTLSSITLQLSHAGLLIRGGIARGDLIHRGSMVYGPSLVQAYELESRRAVHPRIILSDELAAEWGRGTPIVDRKGNLIEVWNNWLRDQGDGETFFDYLGPWLGFGTDPRLLKAQLLPYRSIIMKAFQESTQSPRILEKYLWLARYFNWTLERFPLVDLEKISSPSFGFRPFI